MKIMKKISAVLLSLCLCVPCFSLVAHAADGRISFTDPKTAVGEMVEVRCAVRSTGGNIGDVELELEYDSEYLRFKSGDGLEDNDGTLSYSGNGGSAEVSFTMEFQALKEGETKISVASSSVSNAEGVTWTFDEGSSTVKIAEGDPSLIEEEDEKEEGGDEGTSEGSAGDKDIEVDGVSYTLTDEFADADIPAGYSKTTVSLDGEDRQMVENKNNGAVLGYLRDKDNKGEFFLYSAEDAAFFPYAEISISDTTSIVILSDTSKVKFPKTYQEAKLTLNEKEFPVWQDSTKEDMYVLYAMGSSGEAGYYQYDAAENTYQRMDAPEGETSGKTKGKSAGFGKFQNFVDKHFVMMVLVTGLGMIALIIVVITLAVKLHHRNTELDDLYDEYGIEDEDDDEEEYKEPPVEEKKGLFGKRRRDEDEDDFEDEFEDDFEDEFEEDFREPNQLRGYDEDKFATVDMPESLFEEESLNEFDDDVFSGFDQREELTIDDLDDLLGETPKKKRGRIENEDTFKVDFIDLD